jgi:hypothetical protein
MIRIGKRHLATLFGAGILAFILAVGLTPPTFAATRGPSGGSQTYCIGTTPPPGEVITKEEYNSAYSQCQPTSFAGANVELVVPGPHNGQNMQTCTDSPVPANDVIVAGVWTVTVPSALYNLFASFCNYHTYTITPAVGTTMLICQISHIPTGYTQDGPPFSTGYTQDGPPVPLSAPTFFCPNVPVATPSPNEKYGATNTIRIHQIIPVEPTRSVQ